MKKIFAVLTFFGCQIIQAQNIGIGTTTPLARFHVADSSVLFSLSGDVPFNTLFNPPVSGAGRRMMWYPEKAAFRTGYVDDNSWDKLNIGRYSFAAGSTPMAKGFASVAMGYYPTATGPYGVSIGDFTTASGDYSLALGSHSTASGESSRAIGRYVTASGNKSLAMGNDAMASGTYSVAIGYHVWAAGFGSFFFGDSDPNFKGTTSSGTPNEMVMRFNNGYYLISDDNVPGFVGVRVPPGGNSWTTLSDAKRKENFLPVEGESFLRKIADMNLTTWNYKSQDPKIFRHYGPMAQDFYAAFGKDGFGTIGCDTLINQQDFLGVNLIAIQALESRTTQLNRENQQLREQNKDLVERLEKLERFFLNKQ